MAKHVFHLSFVVPDLPTVRAFYSEALGCRLGRDRGDWVDMLFFGHQLTIHQESESRKAAAIDHFGVVLDKLAWLRILESCRAHGAEFELEPRLLDEGAETESGKFVVRDPAGNLIEFKFYGDFGGTIAG